MRKLIFGLFALLLMMCLPAFAQDASQQGSMGQSGESTKATKAAKTHHIKGTISDDGSSFTSDKDKSTWKIKNPEFVKGHEGHHVVLNAHVYPDTKEVHVMGIKMMSESASNKDQTKY